MRVGTSLTPNLGKLSDSTTPVEPSHASQLERSNITISDNNSPHKK